VLAHLKRASDAEVTVFELGAPEVRVIAGVLADSKDEQEYEINSSQAMER